MAATEPESVFIEDVIIDRLTVAEEALSVAVGLLKDLEESNPLQRLRDPLGGVLADIKSAIW